MMNARTLAICAFGIVFFTPGLEGQDLSRYRNFELGSDLASIATLTGGASSKAKMIHQRPAVLQDLEWRPPRWLPGSTSVSKEAVEQITFSFYNDRLFRIVVDYGYDRTEGMTDADMIEAISAMYGTPLLMARAVARVQPRLEIESGSPVGRWGDTDHAVVVYRTSSYGKALRLIVTDLPLDDLARRADIQAMRLDEQEAPNREIARQKKERDALSVAAEKARVANKAVFRP